MAAYATPVPLFPAAFKGIPIPAPIAVLTAIAPIIELALPLRIAVERPSERLSVFDVSDPDATGLTDCSDAIRSAHDAAVTLGYRYLWFPPGTYFAPTLDGCGNIIFVGPGKLIGAFQKHIVPEHQAPRTLHSDVVPVTQLRYFLAAMAEATPDRPAVIVGMGDSTTRSGSPIGRAETMTDHIQRRLSETFSGADRSIKYLNYGIGGLGWAQAAAPTMDEGIRAPWIRSRDLSWIEHVIAAKPDLVVLNFGQNGGNFFDCRDVRAVHDALRAASASRVQDGERPIDVLLFTPFPSSNMPGSNNGRDKVRWRLDGIDTVAGYLRSFSRLHNYGLVDVHRVGCLVRDGYDVREHAMIRVLTDAPANSIPYTAPVTVDDFEIQFSVGSTHGATFWSHGPLHLKLSAKNGNDLVLERDLETGRLAFTVFAAAGLIDRPRTVTALPPSLKGDQINFTIYVKGSRLFIDRAGFPVLDAPIERHGGLFTPTLTFAGGAVVQGLTIDWLNASSPTLSMPSLTNAEMFGEPDDPNSSAAMIEPWGGNGVNHLSSLGNLMVLGAAMDATRFA